MRLLVFDDDPAIARLVSRVATYIGIEPITVADATAFRQRLRDMQPQVIVLDLQLGTTDGIEQLRVLAERQYAGALIVMSGFDERVLSGTASLARSLGLNLVATLSKPIAVDALEQVLRPLQSAWHLLSPDSLREAIRTDALSVDLQPVVTRHPRTLRKLEALIRWDHPTLGRIPPSEFVPVAESDRELMDSMTDYVVGAVIDAYEVLRELGVAVPIAVNVSTQNLHDLTLPDRLAQRLSNAGMPPAHLCLELTETAASRDAARTMDILTRVRLKGMQLAIDDFGTGFSSLKALRQLPFSTIKIDRTFVTDMATSRDSRAIVKSIIDLASNMEMDSIAEGVETEETAQLLEQMNATALQGFLIAQPMPVEAVPAWLADWRGRVDAPVALVATPAASQPGAVMLAERGDGGAAALTSAAQVVDASVLSPRQLEVIQLLTEGCSVKQIARRLELGVGTVKVHLSRAYSALGARNKVEAVMRAGLTAA
jgi:EAL domain-containing protein (putative c-di-GMP-specific phosphodiesterase class I)/DNA-binding CsgD family transcriptional regulator